MDRIIICAFACALLCTPALGAVNAVNAEESRAWIRYLVPLPKSVEIASKVSVPKGKVEIKPPGETGMIVDQAIKELNELVGKCDGAAQFTLTLAIGGPDAASLKSLKNADQAYRIFAPDGSSAELRLVALSPSGLYYAAKTLQQLVAAESSADSLTIPVVKITDWPDMERRGIWGLENFNHLRWMADRKMNHAEQISACSVDGEGKPVAKLQLQREPMVLEGPIYGITPAPVVLHLEQVGRGKVFEKHPEFKGKSEHEGAMCYSQPGVTDMISDWIYQLASLPNVSEIDCWMAENMQGKKGCQCDKCKGTDRSVMEARVVVAAWRKAMERLGRKITLYVLTSEATEGSNRLFFPELPPEVRIWYYHSLLTYNSWTEPMLRSYLADTAKGGRWMGVCPNLCPYVGFTMPWTGAAFVHDRMNEFIDKGMSGLLSYPSPRVHYYQFNVEAACEWTWNAKGRSPREFAVSWAVRRSLKDPELFADWSETIGQVSWDVYGSAWPGGQQRKYPEPAAVALKKGTLSELGFILWDCYATPWGDIKNPEQLHRDVKLAAKAVELARKMGVQEFMQESLVVDGLIRSLDALYQLKQLVKPAGIAPENHDTARRAFLAYLTSLDQVTQALPRWEKCVMRATEKPGQFTNKPCNFIREMMDEMRETAKGFGAEL